jgi:phage-related protein
MVSGEQRMKFTVEFYEMQSGEIPVQQLINSLEPKMGAKQQISGRWIFELRCKFGSDITRTLYFFYEGATIVLANGFVKKTQKTPKGELKLAKERRRDYLERKEKAR